MKYIKLTAALLALASLIAVGQAPPHKQVSGLLNSSIELPTDINDPVKEVLWKRTNPNNGKNWQIAKIQNGDSVSRLDDRYNPDCNGRVLAIDKLTKDDNGVYSAEVTLPNGTLVTQTFYVTVYDPVPPVQITQEGKRIGDQCNITLTCSVQSITSDLSYTWMYGLRDSPYQSTANTGNIMHIVLPLDHQDMEYMCMVENPADQKNISVHIESCSAKMKKRNHICGIIPAIMMPAVFGAILWGCWKRSSATSRRGDQNETLKPPVQDTETQESGFIDIAHGKIGMKTNEADEEKVPKIGEEPDLKHKFCMQKTEPRIGPCEQAVVRL
ncbi:SLAM family member 5-like isoform X2 [Eleutherodactylus coqui]|uniref:SLAM family member 5-like isoform X2 n=1 Tax=Eleutherodactylus coqui TaxID=57060 RepID=UPI003461EDB1